MKVERIIRKLIKENQNKSYQLLYINHLIFIRDEKLRMYLKLSKNEQMKRELKNQEKNYHQKSIRLRNYKGLWGQTSLLHSNIQISKSIDDWKFDLQK